MKKIISTAMVAVMLAACAPNGQGVGMNKQTGGAILGGVGGAALGSNIGKGKGNIAAIAAGTLLGAMVGSSIGQSLDEVDQMYANRTYSQSLETGRSGQASSWVNPDSGNSGTITPMNVSQNSSGQYCREFRQTIKVGGQTEEGFGTACRQPDGSWKIVQ